MEKDTPETFDITRLIAYKLHGDRDITYQTTSASLDQVIHAGINALMERNGPDDISIQFRADLLIADAKRAGFDLLIEKSIATVSKVEIAAPARREDDPLGASFHHRRAAPRYPEKLSGWPTPGHDVKFTLERDYDPHNLSTRTAPLRRRSTDE